jgi:hypothetical protein
VRARSRCLSDASIRSRPRHASGIGRFQLMDRLVFGELKARAREAFERRRWLTQGTRSTPIKVLTFSPDARMQFQPRISERPGMWLRGPVNKCFDLRC